MINLLIVIEGDTNDADYVKAVSERKFASEQEAEAFVAELKAAYSRTKERGEDFCGKCGMDNWKDDYSEEDAKLLQNFAPCGYEFGPHTLTDLEIYQITKKY